MVKSTLLSGQIYVSDKVCYDLDTAKQIAYQLIEGNELKDIVPILKDRIYNWQTISSTKSEQIDILTRENLLWRSMYVESERVRKINLDAYEKQVKRTKTTNRLLKGLIIGIAAYEVYKGVTR